MNDLENPLDSYYLSQEEPNRACLLAMRAFILKMDANISETRKWGMPCFCLGKQPMCYLWVDKKTKEPYILLVEGRRLDHPALEAGTRAKMKILRVKPHQDLPIETMGEVLKLALARIR